MTKKELISQIRTKQSFLCVGLDPDLQKIPKHLLEFEDPIFEFNKAIIDATHHLCVAYKPNTAFYECLGIAGWKSLEKTINYIPNDCFVIADAKRGDIGNTSSYYAKTFFESLSCDAVTVAPYMGADSVKPFLAFENKWVIRKSQEWGTSENLMYVVGGTRADQIAEVRKLAPDNFFLVPGVGAQGASLDEVVHYGSNDSCGLLVNSSRAIIYASAEKDFAMAAKKEALNMQGQMAKHIQRNNW